MFAGDCHVLVRRSLLAAVVLILTFAGAPVASADSTSNAQFVSYTNSARSQHGLRSYAVSSDLSSIANRWAAHMAANRTLEHNPYASSEVCCWRAMGENVGVGGTVSQIQQAFMASAPHRANILSSTYTEIGVGTARGSDGQLYVDELFRLPTSGAAPRASAPQQVTSPTTGRASRSATRAPLGAARLSALHPSTLHPSTLHPSTWRRNPVTSASRLTPMFLRQVRERLPAAAYYDPIGGAFGYFQVLASVTHVPRHHQRGQR